MRERAAVWATRATPLAMASSVGALMLLSANRGLDVVDEGYMLRLIDNPQATRPAGDVYLFGFVVHPIYRLLGDDVAALRLCGYLAVAAVSGLLCREFLALVRDRGLCPPKAQALTATSAVVASSLFVFSFNVATPAYRSVTLVGLMLTAAGIARAGRRRPVSGGALVGVGGWTTFVGKPTSAAALFVITLVVVVVLRLVSRRLVCAAAGFATVAAAMTLAIAQLSPVAAVTYLARGLSQSDRLGSHSSVAMMLGLTNLRLEGLLALGPLFVLPVVLGELSLRSVPTRWRMPIQLASVVTIIAAIAVTCAYASRTLGP
ncbi:hypothetical protein XE97_24230, partial [Salmonella enterica subsp. enterica serovar Senftenberg]|nr:hypothetical protein [Salmonella enterica subsp. enterica serovar Senftenberg]